METINITLFPETYDILHSQSEVVKLTALEAIVEKIAKKQSVVYPVYNNIYPIYAKVS